MFRKQSNLDMMAATGVVLLRRFLILFLCPLVLGAFISQSQAQFASSPCDPNYYKSLEARAWLEAQREITQNQNLIFKPDSVLEYTCFDKHQQPLAQHAQSMFSETTRWGTILDSSHMDGALTSLVGGAMSAYNANFSHSLLGGRISSSYTLSSSVSGGSYTCETMKDVWEKARCMNFAPNASTDGFYTFSDYESSEKRTIPTSCPGSSLWSGKMDEAGGSTWQSDDVNTYFDKLFPTSGCGSGGASRLRTGLMVKNENATVQSYRETVCLVPGCYWEPTSETAGSCVTP